MSEQRTVARDINSLANSLRNKLEENCNSKFGRKGNNSRGFQNSNDLQDDLQILLEMLTESAPQAVSHVPATDSAEHLHRELDDSLAKWQAQVSLAYSQGASRELSDHLKLALQLQETLGERELRIDEQRSQLESLTAEVLKQQARVSRQRKSIAQALRAQKAEMLLEVHLQRDELFAQAREEALQELRENAPDHSAELQSLRCSLEEAQAELALLNEDRQSRDQQSDLDRLRADELQCQFAQAQKQLEDANLQWEKSQEELRELRQKANLVESLSSELEQVKEQLFDHENKESELSLETGELVADLESQLKVANSEIAQLREDASQRNLPSSNNDSEWIAELELKLESCTQEIQDLQEQNSDLAQQLAKQQVISSGHTPHVNFDQQSLSWEDRKKLIMRQLEDESADANDSPHSVSNRIEIEKVLQATQAEIEKRDREIAELHAIVEQQSDTRQGVAIGAAAFAQVFDNDELIQQERQKLKEIQSEWEEKLRQAEIDLSMERARLARERSQLEAELNSKRDAEPCEDNAGKPKKRKWLEHLGLKDENRS